MLNVKARDIPVSLIQLPTLLFFQFAHFFNQHVVVALDDELEVGWAVFDEEHVKQESEQVACPINNLPVNLYFRLAVEVHGVPKIIVHS